jgi:ketosteroid isomerase-like protein
MNRVARGHPRPCDSIAGPERADDRFFAALLAADTGELGELLAADFLLVDVVGGNVVERGAFIATVGDGVLGLTSIRVLERRTRRHGDTAIVVGRTQLEGRFEAAPFEAASRYTHVLVRGADRQWRLVNAQGTPIADEPPQQGEVW